jgi:hypothetical protein
MKYQISCLNKDDNKVDMDVIDGEPCLQEEFPQLELFVGKYPCEHINTDSEICGDCINGLINCTMYRVSEKESGTSLMQRAYTTPEMAIEAAKYLIENIGVEKVLQAKKTKIIQIENSIRRIM